MDFISPIISPIVESLMVPVKKHLGFLVFSTKYVQDMNARMEQLKATAKEVQHKRDMAFANTEEIPKRVEPWLEDVKKMNEKVQSIEGGFGCFNVSKRYKAGKRSSSVVKEIEDLEKQELKIKFTNEKISLAKVPSTARPSTLARVHEGIQNNFESRLLIFNDALKSLQTNNEGQKMIALCGMGGIGKTTMMEELEKVAEGSKIFDWIVKVVVGESNDIIAIKRGIAERIQKDLAESAKDARADRLRNIFEGMSQQGQKKILVIIDDAWKEIDLKDVGLTSPLPNGFKLLLTSRFENVCTRMGVQADSTFRVGVLNDTEAKSLFLGTVGPSLLDGADPELYNIGEHIVKKSGGLPIALKTIAINLRDEIKDAWKENLSNLQHHDLQDLDEVGHLAFEMSYNNLKKEDDKALFLHSGLFPDDVDIKVEDLTRYGWGLRLFTKVRTLGEARRRTNICVNNLIRANLLIKSESVGCVKMHDLVRAFVLSNFSKVKQASIVNNDNMAVQQLTEESYERILLNYKDMFEFPAGFNLPNLSLLILMEGDELRKFPEDIYRRTKSLEVLSYKNMALPSFPVTFECLTKLRTLVVCF